MPFLQEFISVNPIQQDLRRFDCGQPAKNQFLYRHAAKHMALQISTTWCLLCLQDDGTAYAGKAPVAAYFTLTSQTVTRSQIGMNKAPPFDLPVALLAKLAIDKQFHRQGLGSKTLIYALRHAIYLIERGIPAVGLIVDVADEDALAFYQSFDFFQPLEDDPMRLFVSTNDLQQLQTP